MRRLRRSVLALSLSSALLSGTALAQQSPTSTWNDSLTWRSPLDRSVDLNVAVEQERARHGGNKGAQINTTYNGDVTNTEYNEYQGSVSQNTSTNAANLNSFSSSVDQNGSGTASVTFQTGSTSYNADQSAVATHSGPDGATTTASAVRN